jgi:hypothetical protein
LEQGRLRVRASLPPFFCVSGSSMVIEIRTFKGAKDKPVFDKKGKIVDSDKTNANDNWPILKDLDEIVKSDRKNPLSLLDKIPRTLIVLAVVVIVFLIASHTRREGGRLEP